MAKQSRGVSGIALVLIVAGIYLAYVGVKDVPVIGGVRDIIEGKKPGNG